MDKNNDIQVNKVDKWCEGVADVSLWQAKKSVDMFLCGYSSMLSIEALDAVRTIYVALDEALDRFNELEAKYQKQCGMISEYAEENARLKQKNEKASNNIRDLRQVLEENDIATYLNPVTVSWGVANIALQKKTEHFNTQLDNLRERLREAERNKEDALRKMIQEVTELEEEKIELEVKLAQSDELRYRNAKYAWAIKTILKKATYSPSRVGEELRFMARKSTTPKDVFERWEGIADELLGEHSKLVDKIEWLEKKNEKLSSQVSGLKEENDKLRVLTICGEIKWVLGEDDV